MKQVMKDLMTYGEMPQDEIYKLFKECGYETNTKIFDEAADEVISEDEDNRRHESEWRSHLPSQKERENVFIDAGTITKEDAERRRKDFLLNEYKEKYRAYLLQKSGDKAAKKLENEITFRDKKDKISDEDIKRARETPISNFVELPNSRMIKCPVHNDKNPSCHVTKNLFHCFSCGAGGDTIRFIEKTQSLKFIDAVKYILNA